MAEQLIFDRAIFDSFYPFKPFVMRHRLVDHPLFALPRLVQLSKTLPAANVEYNAGEVQVNQDPTSTPRTGLSMAETIQRIEQAHSWMVLKYVETDPEYRDLLYSCLDEARMLAEVHTPGAFQYEGFIFITSPKAVTPYHMDPEHNFLLQ
ncbi:MAG TPA: hypothetical protein VMS71_01425, partial [Candidatus Acidoferrum sp.]|nr:hypothetical protein [Candidatus Acidoferrum sp.]